MATALHQVTEPLEVGYTRNGYEDPSHPTIVYGPRVHRVGSRVTVVERVDGTRFTVRVPAEALSAWYRDKPSDTSWMREGDARSKRAMSSLLAVVLG